MANIFHILEKGRKFEDICHGTKPPPALEIGLKLLKPMAVNSRGKIFHGIYIIYTLFSPKSTHGVNWGNYTLKMVLTG